MPAAPPTYVKNAEAPPLEVRWETSAGAVLALSSGGFTVTGKLFRGSSSTVLSTIASVAAADSDPNLTITWNAAAFSALTPGEYTLELVATASSKDRIVRTRLVILPSAP